MALAEAAACGVPDYGLVVERRHLLRVARTQSPRLTVICAPPGCGKSVFAAQYAAALDHDEVLWVPLYDSDVCGTEWLGRVVEALSPGGCDEVSNEGLPRCACEMSRADLALRARECLSTRAGRSVHLVLDGAGCVDGLEALVDLAALLRRCTNAASRLTITCRSIRIGATVPDPAMVWMVGAEELVFDRSEVVMMLASAEYEGDLEQRAAELLERFAGHPALTSLMLRHENVNAGSSLPLDLVWHVQRLATMLSDESLTTAYCAALLREGAAAELDDCLARLGDITTDWDGMTALAPLLGVERDNQGRPLRFRMHGVLCAALISLFPSRCGDEGAVSLRAGVISHLTQMRDFARLQPLLVEACTDGEIAAFCEGHWADLLSSAGPKAAERLLARIPAVTMSSSAPLLLLRAVVLRESERSEEAALYASLAQRIAEADGDLRTQTGAMLIGVAAAISAADLVTANEVLGEIDGTMRDELDRPALCLFESYRADLASYRTDYASARTHLSSAIEMLERIDSRSWETVWATNGVCGCLGQMQGRWDVVRTLMARCADWPGITPLQRLQVRANNGCAALEMGCIRETVGIVERVLHEILDAELGGIAAYALGTLADALWYEDRRAAEEAYLQSQSMLAAIRDETAMVMEQSHRAMLTRADGASEQSLALAEMAVAQLQAKGPCIRLLSLAAEIEMAASLLAFGDRWGARRIASRILADLEDSGAAMHLLLASLVMAEILRQEGDRRAAVALLQQHADHITTGSANWRTAMYCRAFPGLLSLLAEAIGAEHLPLRMLRLISPETIDAAASCDDSGLAGDALAVIAKRAVPEAPALDSTPVVSPSAPPLCRVRLFGGLEVTLGDRPITDESWRKRKVRLLFAMLASRCGQDVPRDVLLERLWPDMDDERARRNFYVTWSAVKRALANGGPPSCSAHLLRSSGGVCRITRDVRVDLQDFDEALVSLRESVAIHDALATMAAARSLASIYRGELLPGDIYEEWFSDIRERTKHDFCDAMTAAARVAEASGQPDDALVFLRRAGLADPWREDIYQAMMRCQMLSGQRSSAIETYIACRGRLVDDLGIDPSAETTKLYEAVLAMEANEPNAE